LQVREFAREDERRVLLVLDAAIPAEEKLRDSRQAIFERGVALCASLAWHFYEINSVLAFRSGTFETPMAPAGENVYAILRYLASAAPADTDRSVLAGSSSRTFCPGAITGSTPIAGWWTQPSTSRSDGPWWR